MPNLTVSDKKGMGVWGLGEKGNIYVHHHGKRNRSVFGIWYLPCFFSFLLFFFFYSGVVIKEVNSGSLSSRTFLKMMMVIIRIDDEMK